MKVNFFFLNQVKYNQILFLILFKKVLLFYFSSKQKKRMLENFNLAMFEEVLRRCVYRQKRAFLVYETLIGFSLIVFVLSAGNCLLNLGLCWSGLDQVIQPVLPVFLYEKDSPPVTTSLTLPKSFITSKPTSKKRNSQSASENLEDENSMDDDDEEKGNNKIENEEEKSKQPKFIMFLCFNQPINIFWIFGLRLDLVCVMSFVASSLLFLIVRGVFALRRPDTYVKGLNASLKREYGWRFDEEVGKLVVLPK
jgi:hypothetical protein